MFCRHLAYTIPYMAEIKILKSFLHFMATFLAVHTAVVTEILWMKCVQLTFAHFQQEKLFLMISLNFNAQCPLPTVWLFDCHNKYFFRVNYTILRLKIFFTHAFLLSGESKLHYWYKIRNKHIKQNGSLHSGS